MDVVYVGNAPSASTMTFDCFPDQYQDDRGRYEPWRSCRASSPRPGRRPSWHCKWAQTPVHCPWPWSSSTRLSWAGCRTPTTQQLTIQLRFCRVWKSYGVENSSLVHITVLICPYNNSLVHITIPVSTTTIQYLILYRYIYFRRAQWLRGRALDSRLQETGFESCAAHCSSSLSCMSTLL